MLYCHSCRIAIYCAPQHCSHVLTLLQVGKTGTDCKADLEMLSLHDLRKAMPGLWKTPADTKHPPVVYTRMPLSGPTAAAMAQGVPDMSADILEEYRRRAIKVAVGE